MNVSLNPELEEYVRTKVANGLYASASEVVRDALRALRERDELHATRLDAVRMAIAEGVAAADAGDLIDGDQVVAEIRALLNTRRTKAPDGSR